MARKRSTFTLTYNMNERGDEPRYEYLYRCIREDITAGTIPAGSKLPSKRVLAEHLEVAVSTVAAAYEQLSVEGFISAHERSGYYVEDVSNYRSKPAPAPTVQTPQQSEQAQKATRRRASAAKTIQDASDQDFFVDMKVNRASVLLFPSTVWAHYMREALSFPSETLLQSVPFNGLLELRQAIAAYLKRARGVDVSPDCIIVGAGSEYLYSRLLQMFGPHTMVAMENPGYSKFSAISHSFGTPWCSVPIDDSGMDVAALAETGAQVAHVSPANHFPTGIVMPIKRRLELFEWANDAPGRFIIEDDYDSEFRYSGRPIMPLLGEDAAGRVIYLNAFSKTMVPSLRISYMVLPARLLKRYVDTMSFYSCTVSSIEQYALARFIDEGHFERHINRMRTFYRTQRGAVLDAIAESRLAGISHVEERNAGTHFLLCVETALSDEEVRERGAKLGLNISMLGDYELHDTSLAALARTRQSTFGQKDGMRVLVLNYAGIAPDRVAETIARLQRIFPECSERGGVAQADGA